MARTGRPTKVIDKTEFEKLCALQCTLSEVCAFFDVEDDTLNGWCKRTYGMTFSDVFAQKRGLGKVSLRRAQWRLAEKNATMAIWLGKQYLDQKDDVTNDNTEVLTRLDEVLATMGNADAVQPEAE